MNYQKFSLLFGFSVWLVATLVFRYLGHTFFLIENDLLITGFFIATIPLLYFLIQWVFRRYELNEGEKVRSVVLMALPGMIGDVACIKFHAIVFPTLTVEQAVVLGSWVLWAYTIVLLTGLIDSKKLMGAEKQKV